MTKKISVLVAIAALVVGVALLAVPAVSHAITITSVSVTVDGSTWCGSTTAGTCTIAGIGTRIWDAGLGATGVTITNGASLTLAQTGGTFSFDTSDVCFGGGCAAPTIVVNGITFTDSSLVLATKNLDPGGAAALTFNEAQDYSSASGALAGVSSVSAGYFDNLHPNACGSGVGPDPDLNCMPEPFFGGGGNTLIGDSSASFPGLDSNHAPCDGVTTSGCWDSGVVRIVSSLDVRVPEPSTLLLLGVGLIGLAAYGRNYLKKGV